MQMDTEAYLPLTDKGEAKFHSWQEYLEEGTGALLMQD